jgi:hypothetical protein
MSFGALPAVILVRIFEYQAPSVSCARVMLRDGDVWHQLIVPWLRSLAPWLAPLPLNVTARVPTTFLETTRALALRVAGAIDADAEVVGEIKTAYSALKEFAADESDDVRLVKLLGEARRSCQGMQKAAQHASADVAALADHVNELRMQNILAETLRIVPDASTCRLFLSVYGKRSATSSLRNHSESKAANHVTPHFLKAVANGLHHPLVLELLYRDVAPDTLLCVAAASPHPHTLSTVLEMLRTRIPVSHTTIRLRDMTLLRLLGCGVQAYVTTVNVLFELRQWTSFCSWAPIPRWRMCEKMRQLVHSSTKYERSSDHEDRRDNHNDKEEEDDEEEDDEGVDVEEDGGGDEEKKTEKKEVKSSATQSRGRRTNVVNQLTDVVKQPTDVAKQLTSLERRVKRTEIRDAKRARKVADATAQAAAIKAEHIRRGFSPNRTRDVTLDDSQLHEFLYALEERRYRQTPMRESVSLNGSGSSSSSSSSDPTATIDIRVTTNRIGDCGDGGSGDGGNFDDRDASSVRKDTAIVMQKTNRHGAVDPLIDIFGSPVHSNGYFTNYHFKHTRGTASQPDPLTPSSLCGISSSLHVSSTQLSGASADIPSTVSVTSPTLHVTPPSSLAVDEKDACIIDYLLYYHTNVIDIDTLLIMWRLEPRVVGLALQNSDITCGWEAYDGSSGVGSTLSRYRRRQHAGLRANSDTDGEFFRHEGAGLPPEMQLAYLRRQLLTRTPTKDGSEYAAATEHLSSKRVSSLLGAIDPKLESFPSFVYRKNQGTKRLRKIGTAGMCLRTLEFVLDYAASHNLLANMAKQMHVAREHEGFALLCWWTHDMSLMMSLMARYPAFIGEICGVPGTVDIRAAPTSRHQRGDVEEDDDEERAEENEDEEVEDEPSDTE